MKKPFYVRLTRCLTENEHKIFQKDRKVEYNDCYIVKIENLTFEIVRN